MEKINNQVKQILHILFVNGHGESADIINKYNNSSNLPTFGIMYPQLKTFAHKFEPNNKVAMILMHKNTRDARIMGILLSNVNAITINEALKMSEMLITEELKNIFAHHTLSQFPYITELPLTYSKLFCFNLTLKAIVQHYRREKTTTTYKISKTLFHKILDDKNTSKTDIKNFIEIVYKNSISDRTDWINFLTIQTKDNKELKPLIYDAINDFKYID